VTEQWGQFDWALANDGLASHVSLALSKNDEVGKERKGRKGNERNRRNGKDRKGRKEGKVRDERRSSRKVT
jgi:hypothetical protein